MRTLVTARHLTIALAGILIGFTLSGAAYAISAAGFRYSAPQTGYLMIPSGAFSPFNQGAIYSRNGAVLSTSNSACFEAPVNLPQGAKVTQLAAWYSLDGGPAGDLNFFRLSLAAQSSEIVAALTIDDTGAVFKSTASNAVDTSLQTVNNRPFTYFLSHCMAAAEFLLGVRITYTYTSAGD
jgi:hypothetical protein